MGSPVAEVALVRRLGFVDPALLAQGSPDPTLRDYILLIAILVAFLEATAQQLTPIQAPVVVVMGFTGLRRVNGSTPPS